MAIDSSHYRALQEKLSELKAAPVPDMAAIDAVIEALAAEQLRLKEKDGQPGNNPIEPRREHPSAA